MSDFNLILDGKVILLIWELLTAVGEVTISEYGCHWWGRQTSGQAVYMDCVIQKIVEGLN